MGCTITNRSETSCIVHVGLNSKTKFDVRVREACSSPVLASAWIELDSPVETQTPATAGVPTNIAYSLVIPFFLRLSATPGVAMGQCQFEKWHFEVLKRVMLGNMRIVQQPAVAACSSFQRSVAECDVDTTGLELAPSHYSIQVTEVCTDTNANSVSAITSSLQDFSLAAKDEAP
jgi:hypothetical protein